MNYIFKTDRSGRDRVIRTRYPVFTGTIVNAYDITDGKQCSKSHKDLKVIYDDILDECSASKLEWASKKAITNFLYQDSKPPLEVNEDAFSYIKSNRNYLNLTSIEEASDISRTSLTTAINRDQKKFGQSAKLHKFLDNNFPGWDNE